MLPNGSKKAVQNNLRNICINMNADLNKRGRKMERKISDELFEKSKKYIPGGVNSPVRAFNAVGGDPIFIKSGKGDKVYDVDGNEFIDYVSSWGPLILGHAYEPVLEAVNAACANGLTFGAPTGIEYDVAELITKMMPSVEKVRMVNSGTEAVMSAIRVARGYTGRDYIIKFVGCYHGHSDGLLVKAGSGALTQSAPDSAGVPEGYAQYTLLADYNDTESVQRLFDEYKDKIAAVVVEPVAANMGVVPPEPGFLESLRKMTTENGALLIFDEVITGFRLARGGAQEKFGVQADLTTLGKIIGGGMPVGAYGGRKDIMDKVAPVGSVYQAGTLSGNPVAMSAGLTQLSILNDNPELYDSLEQKASILENAYREKFGDSVWVNRVGSVMSVFFTREKVRDYNSALTSDTEAFSRYFRYMIENGIYIAPSQFEAIFVSAALTDEDLNRTIDVIKAY